MLSALVDVLYIVKLLFSWFQVLRFTLQPILLKPAVVRIVTLASFETAGKVRKTETSLCLEQVSSYSSSHICTLGQVQPLIEEPGGICF